MISTKNCIICFNEAKEWGGHVHKENVDVLAGFCNEHFKQRKIFKTMFGCQGCFGQYKPAMELINEESELYEITSTGINKIS